MASNGNMYISTVEKRKIIVETWLNEQIDIDRLFACAICRNPDNTIHCPKCSKLFCADCIKKWFNPGRPQLSIYSKGCRCFQTKVSLEQFSYCRVYQEVRKLIEVLMDNMDQLIHLLSKVVNACEKHNKELLLFCVKCSKCVCVKCILNDQHRFHIDEVLELDDARLKLNAMVTTEKNFLVDRITALNRARSKIDEREHQMHSNHGTLVKELTGSIDKLFEKIQDDKEKQINQYLEPIKHITRRQQRDVEKALKKLFKLHTEKTSPDVVMNTLQTVDAIKKMHDNPLPVLQFPNTELINPISPPPVELNFSMHSFTRRILQSCLVLSLPECIEGFLLQLKGHVDADEDMIKLSLRIVDGYDVNDIKVICYPTKGGEPLIRRIDLRKNEDNTVLEFSDFPSMGGFLEARSDELHVQMKFNLWASYYDKCAHKDWYIKKLTKTNRNAIE